MARIGIQQRRALPRQSTVSLIGKGSLSQQRLTANCCLLLTEAHGAASVSVRRVRFTPFVRRGGRLLRLVTMETFSREILWQPRASFQEVATMTSMHCFRLRKQ